MWKSMFLNNAKTNFNNQNVGEYLPENGKLIVFPSWLEHSVLANKTNEIRISIAFNVNKVK
jgi:ectoine hydroxylase-related dioxygenase (phytanoyl-CoA dioxygenase family)